MNKKYCDFCGIEITSEPYFNNTTMIACSTEEDTDKFDLCRKCLRTKTPDEIAKHLLAASNKRATRATLTISIPIDFRDT